MDSLGEQTLSYYNIPAEVLVKKQNGSYIINTSSQEERFQNLIWKISAEKYMAVSETVLLHLSDEVVKELSGYVEINFVDQDVVQLVHQDGTYQTISGDAYIELANGARLNLATRSIVYGEEEKLSLAQMVIDSDDNIEVVDNRYGQEKASAEPSGESSAEPSASNGQGGGNNQNSNSEQTNNGQNNSGGGSGNEGGGNSEGEGDAPEVDTDVAFPTFSVTNFETDVVSVDATIEITDDDGLLSEKGVDYSIIERGTNKLVYKVHKEGVFDVRIGTDILSPDTEYTLIANSDYIYKGRDVQQGFRFLYLPDGFRGRRL